MFRELLEGLGAQKSDLERASALDRAIMWGVIAYCALVVPLWLLLMVGLWLLMNTLGRLW